LRTGEEGKEEDDEGEVRKDLLFDPDPGCIVPPVLPA